MSVSSSIAATFLKRLAIRARLFRTVEEAIVLESFLVGRFRLLEALLEEGLEENFRDDDLPVKLLLSERLSCVVAPLGGFEALEFVCPEGGANRSLTGGGTIVCVGFEGNWCEGNWCEGRGYVGGGGSKPCVDIPNGEEGRGSREGVVEGGGLKET